MDITCSFDKVLVVVKLDRFLRRMKMEISKDSQKMLASCHGTFITPVLIVFCSNMLTS